MYDSLSVYFVIYAIKDTVPVTLNQRPPLTYCNCQLTLNILLTFNFVGAESGRVICQNVRLQNGTTLKMGE